MTPDRACPLRAAVLGVAAAVLGVAAHGEAGGAVGLSGPAALVAALVVLVTALVGARPASPARTAAVLAGGQLALHLAMPVGHHAASMSGHTMGGHTMPTAADPGVMVLAHLVAAMLVGAGLVRADRALARTVGAGLVRALARWSRLVRGPAPAGPAVLLVPLPTLPGCPRRAAVGHHPRRGPPSRR